MRQNDRQDAALVHALHRVRERTRAQTAQGIDHRALQEIDGNLLYGDRDQALLPDLRRSLDEVNQTWQVQEQPFTSRIPLMGRLISLFRELWNRISTKWYILPMLQQQISFNQAVNRSLGNLYEYLSISTLGMVRRIDFFFQALEEKQLVQTTYWQEALGDLSRQAALISETRETLAALQEDQAQTRQAITALQEGQVQAIAALQKDQAQAIATLQEDLIQAIAALQKDQAQMRQAISTLQDDQTQAIAALQKDQAQTITALQKDQAQAIIALQEDQAQVITALQEDRVQWKEQVIDHEQSQDEILEDMARDRLPERTQRLERQVAALQEQEGENRRGYALQRIWLERLLLAQEGPGPENRPASAQAAPLERIAPLDDHDYFVFENAFRGPITEIRRKQEGYLPAFADGGPVVDIGCGRGEFLELLREHDIPAYGIEVNEQMILICREKGLDVRQGEAFTHLAGLPNGSLGGLFLSHVVEHLPTARLSELARLALQKLRPGAHLIAETPNPTCLWTFARQFYLDMSHTRPLHPEALAFLFEMAGFSASEIRYLNRVPEQEQLVTLPPGEEAPETEMGQAIWENFGRLNDLIYGYQDYAIIAKK